MAARILNGPAARVEGTTLGHEVQSRHGARYLVQPLFAPTGNWRRGHQAVGVVVSGPGQDVADGAKLGQGRERAVATLRADPQRLQKLEAAVLASYSQQQSTPSNGERKVA